LFTDTSFRWEFRGKHCAVTVAALAVLAAASGAAMAQSSVTLFGVVDATLAFGRGTTYDKNQLTNSGYNSSRLGFRGTEDLGGGMAASFWLEAALANDNGTGGSTNTSNQVTGAPRTATNPGGLDPVAAGSQGLTFNRRSTVSLSGGFGEVRLGRDYSPTFWNLTVFDPFGTNGVGTTQTLKGAGAWVPEALPTGVRTSNGIGYLLPGNLGGFYGQVQYYLGENNSNAGNKKDGNGAGLRFGFANGPFNVAVAASSTKYLAGDLKTMNVGGQYDLGVAKLMGQISQDKVLSTKGTGWLFGALVPMGAGEIRASLSSYKVDAGTKPQVDKFAVGYVHNLSKRTALYTTYARLKNKNGSSQALNGSSTGIDASSSGLDLGIRHSF
jgi:predicted porin